MFLRRSVERQSSCDSIIADCTNRSISLAEQYNLTTTEGLHRYLSAVAVLQCESCFGDLERYYRCTGDNDSAVELREADCARSDNDGKYCAQSIFDGIASGDLPVCGKDDDICDATCQDLRTQRNYGGCCASSYAKLGLLPNTTQQFEDCGVTLYR